MANVEQFIVSFDLAVEVIDEKKIELVSALHGEDKPLHIAWCELPKLIEVLTKLKERK